MARLFIVTPAGAGLRNGNRHTALRWATLLRASGHRVRVEVAWNGEACDALIALHARRRDRKSTRLNSSHLVISYAVFCLKKKNNKTMVQDRRSLQRLSRSSRQP